MIHFATLKGSTWRRLCDDEPADSTAVHSTLVQESDITCEECKTKWRAGMRRVRRLFRNYRGEE